MAFSIDNFSTPQQWKFGIISDPEINDKNEAIKQGNENIGLLTLTGGPDSSGNEWTCDYEYDDGQKFVVAMAITPPGKLSLLQTKRF